MSLAGHVSQTRRSVQVSEASVPAGSESASVNNQAIQLTAVYDALQTVPIAASVADVGVAPIVAESAPEQPPLPHSVSQITVGCDSGSPSMPVRQLCPASHSVAHPQPVNKNAEFRRRCDECLAINPSGKNAFVVMTGGKAQSWDTIKFPKIPSNLHGMALKEVVVEFQQAALAEYHLKPCDERFFLSKLLIQVGHDSPLYLKLTKPAYDVQMNFQPPIDVFNRQAEDDFNAHQRRLAIRQSFADSTQLETFRRMVQGAYPPYEPSQALADGLAYWEGKANQVTLPYQDVQRARDEHTKLLASVTNEQLLHDGRELEDQYYWLLNNSDPQLEA